MSDHKLAIIIPAYKAEYLAATLSSLEEQTDNRFTVYIGDDCSPYDLKSIVDVFVDKLNIVYYRFDENMGSISLTKQWERCVAISDEEWIWLFSDDDVIQKDAVQTFYESIDKDCLLYKFHTKVIDEKGNINPYYSRFDKINQEEGFITSIDFLYKRLNGQGYRSFAVEYVCHRSFFSTIGFIDFPSAWNSDDATWLAYSIANGKKMMVLNSYVYWRLSSSNITSDTKSDKMVKEKVEASVLYIKWLEKLIEAHDLERNDLLVLKWFSIQIGIFMPQISRKDFYKLLEQLPYSFKFISISFYFLRYVRFQGIKRTLKAALRLNK